jgi:hypothetical protein
MIEYIYRNNGYSLIEAERFARYCLAKRTGDCIR